VAVPLIRDETANEWGTELYPESAGVYRVMPGVGWERLTKVPIAR